MFALKIGDFPAVDELLDDVVDISTAIGLPTSASACRAALAAWRGQREETESIIERPTRDRAARGERDWQIVDYCTAVLNNGQSDYAAAFAAARNSAYEHQLVYPELLLPELVQSAVRLGEQVEAEMALESLVAGTTASGTSWALRTEAYCRAQLAQGDTAETLYRQAIERFDACRVAPFRHRARLVFGECYAENAAASRHATNSRPPTKRSPRWARMDSPNAPAANWLPPAGRCLAEPNRPRTSSPAGTPSCPTCRCRRF